MVIKRGIRKLLRRMGFDLVRYDAEFHPLARRARLLSAYGINLVLDVGANTGQYAGELRSIGYAGKIMSFEPLHSAYRELARRAHEDAAWTALNTAVGDRSGKIDIHVAANSLSSSILEMLPAHLRSAPESRYCGKEEVDITRLDLIYETYDKGDHVYLKIDTQGFERRVIEGAGASLDRINTIQLEMSLAPMYKDETPFIDMYRLLSDRGYLLVSLEQGFSDPATGQTLQVDGIFHRFENSSVSV